MADDNAKLLIVLEAQSKKLQNQLVDATRTIDRFAAQTNRRFDAMNAKNAASFDKLGRRIGTSMSALSGVIGKAFAGAAALKGAQELIDASTRIENSLKVAGLAGEELTAVYDKLFASAKKNAAPLEALVELYGRASLNQKELGVSSADLLTFTDNIALALRVSGKSAAESSGALLQLSQALGSGTVRAEEFNSILEGAPTILQAAANGITEAGGSVSKLRQLMLDGKLSSEGLFLGIQAGSDTMRDKVSDSVFTISQQFENLRTTLIDTAGDFDTATNASGRTGVALETLAAKIQQIGEFFAANAGTITGTIDNLIRFVDAVNSIPGVNPVQQFTDGIADLAGGISEAKDAWDGLNAEVSMTSDEMMASIIGVGSALGEWSAQLPPELAAKIQEIISKIDGTKPSADEAARAIEALGNQNPNFTLAITSIGNLIAEMSRLRGEAYATAEAVANAPVAGSAGSVRSDQRAEQNGNRPRQTISLADHLPPSTPKKGSSKQSPGEKFADTLDDQERRNRLLREETALQATLNPLVNDYGFAIEELRIKQDLLAAAEKAGIELTPALESKINELATGYATASVEAQKLADSQDQLRQTALDWASSAKDITGSFVQDLIAGKSAAEALGNALTQVGNKLLDAGLDALFGTGSGSSPFGALGSLFGLGGGAPPGRAAGGPVQAGKPYVVGERRPELFVPNASGRIIPHVPGPVSPRSGGSSSTSFSMPITIDATGADAAGLARVERKVAELKASLPGTIKHVVSRRNKDIW